MKVLVTRPSPDGETTAVRLAHLGHEVVYAPLIEIVPVAHHIDVAGVQALAFTSANTIRVLDGGQVESLRALPVFAVGGRTTEAARRRGFADVTEAGPDAEALAARLARLDADAGVVLHLSGRDIARDLSDLVTDGPEIRREIVYEAVPRAALPEAAMTALSGRRIDAVLHFSPRSARIFGRLIKDAGLIEAASVIRHLALSDRVAQALREVDLPVAAIAADPTEAALIACLDASTGDSTG